MARARVERSRAHHPASAPFRPGPAPVRPVDAPAMLDAVEHLLRTRGWCQGRPQDRSGRLSLDGAVEEAAATLARTERERLVLAARTRNRLTRCAGAGALAAWNDRPGRNQAEINELIAIARFLST
jgi:hypothetical protein